MSKGKAIQIHVPRGTVMLPDNDQWKTYDKQRMSKEVREHRLERIKTHLVRFEQWFAQKFGWFFSPKRYK